MALSKITQPLKCSPMAADPGELTVLTGLWQGAGAAALTKVRGSGDLSITRDGAGDFTITVGGRGNMKLVSIQTEWISTDFVAKLYASAPSAANRTIDLNIDDTGPRDATSSEYIALTVVLRESI